jgi:hypothetical protein
MSVAAEGVVWKGRSARSNGVFGAEIESKGRRLSQLWCGWRWQERGKFSAFGRGAEINPAARYAHETANL